MDEDTRDRLVIAGVDLDDAGPYAVAELRAMDRSGHCQSGHLSIHHPQTSSDVQQYKRRTTSLIPSGLLARCKYATDY